MHVCPKTAALRVCSVLHHPSMPTGVFGVQHGGAPRLDTRSRETTVIKEFVHDRVI